MCCSYILNFARLSSLYLGGSDSNRPDGVCGAGNFSSLLQYLDKGHDAADVQFWKRMADPVLVHDSFSSFLWLLFCLPLPFPANGAPFTALVHLFYLVSVTQVLSALDNGFIFKEFFSCTLMC